MNGKTPGQAADAETLIKAAQHYDHTHREPRRNWRAVPDDQVHRLLTGAGFLVPQPSPGLPDVLERLENLAAGMELSATATRPSKKTEIEERWARSVREIIREITPEPAITGAGTEHLARQLLDPKYPDGPAWQAL